MAITRFGLETATPLGTGEDSQLLDRAFGSTIDFSCGAPVSETPAANDSHAVEAFYDLQQPELSKGDRDRVRQINLQMRGMTVLSFYNLGVVAVTAKWTGHVRKLSVETWLTRCCRRDRSRREILLDILSETEVQFAPATGQ